VTITRALVHVVREDPPEGVRRYELGPIGPLPEQARLTDFYIPQQSLFAVGRAFLTPVTRTIGALDASLSGN
jgi:hypothetical protein